MKIGGNLMDENDEGNVKNALNYLKSYKMDADAQQKTKVDDDIELEQEQSNKYGYPNLLADTTLERRYIGLILNQIKAIFYLITSFLSFLLCFPLLLFLSFHQLLLYIQCDIFRSIVYLHVQQ